MAELERDSYDVVVLGTGLAESIAAAALAKAGQSVLHLDPNDYYGGEHASLTLDELVGWAAARGAPSRPPSSPIAAGARAPDASPADSSAAPSAYLAAQRARYTSVTHSPLTPALVADQRRYALSLWPAALPARGALIDALIDSGVSKYVSFCMLDGVAVWAGGDVAAAAEPVLSPSSTEPVLSPSSTEAGPSDAHGGGAARHGEAARFRRVPGSKEDIFRDRAISLPDKRRLMKFLMMAAGDYAADPVYTDQPLPALLSAYAIPPSLAGAITYALAYSPAPAHAAATASAALARLQRYLGAVGRYGPSPFLVAQYGGAGEIAQAFCRACAVCGGTYVLGQAAAAVVARAPETGDGAEAAAAGEAGEAGEAGKAGEAGEAGSSGSGAATEPAAPKTPGTLQLTIPAHPRPVRARWVVAAPDYLPADLAPAAAARATETTAHCVAISAERPAVLGPAGAGDGDDTALVVFPPGEGDGAGGPRETGETGETGEPVRALIMGEGTGSCPAGHYVIYLLASTARDPTFLRPYLHALARPAFEAYYSAHRPGPPDEPGAAADGASADDAGGAGGVVVLRPYAGPLALTEALDYEAREARRAVGAIMGGAEGAGGAGSAGWFVRDAAEGDEDEGEL